MIILFDQSLFSWLGAPIWRAQYIFGDPIAGFKSENKELHKKYEHKLNEAFFIGSGRDG